MDAKNDSQKAEAHTTRMQVTGVPKTLRNEFQAICDKKGLTESSVVKNMLHDYVQQHKQNNQR